MSTVLTNPLQALIGQASEQESLGEVSKLRQRQQQATSEIVILADVSSSMSEVAGGKTKIEILREALSHVWPDCPNAHLITFSSLPAFMMSPNDLPAPSGGTALHLAIEAAQPLRPGQTIVISDGQPDDQNAALAAANSLTGRIDVIYCGPDSDLEAIAFLQRLARSTGGQCVVTPQNANQSNSLLEPVRRLLLLPEAR